MNHYLTGAQSPKSWKLRRDPYLRGETSVSRHSFAQAMSDSTSVKRCGSAVGEGSNRISVLCSHLFSYAFERNH